MNKMNFAQMEELHAGAADASCKWAVAGWYLANVGVMMAPFTGGLSLAFAVVSWGVATGGLVTSCR